MKIAYCHKTDRLGLDIQYDAEKAWNADKVFTNVPVEAVDAREADEVGVFRLVVLAGGASTYQDFVAAMQPLFDKRAVIIELESMRRSDDAGAWTAALADAARDLRGDRWRNGPGVKGRPRKRVYTDAEKLIIEAEWRARHATNAARVAAIVARIGEPFDYNAGYVMLGAPGKK
ncbi:MAG: hypothetical protein OEQ29_08905 [Alphaproteobacteria bacterium]|nr:hypothetical protein [Alphaproteobacteria bacterium]